jgi:hypothetical protein
LKKNRTGQLENKNFNKRLWKSCEEKNPRKLLKRNLTKEVENSNQSK